MVCGEPGEVHVHAPLLRPRRMANARPRRMAAKPNFWATGRGRQFALAAPHSQHRACGLRPRLRRNLTSDPSPCAPCAPMRRRTVTFMQQLIAYYMKVMVIS